ncbi:Fe-S cluster assembly protein SufD [Natronocella acetinitrilica]|uniref:Fe-S cluster assembly protein SufD n=1 Tax=Natronocella acetinitrilica TaxID=414046 RepID=A0AAE3G349_9GAMM|nr:Fe-S cluster assembly protein SufD [Natronocella acetinitrilica]MCP1674940.1 Fe-S cluster assembly protein SufD [Natronocella acetinitrilica]
MSAVAEEKSVYLADFEAQAPAAEPAWLRERREAGIRAFEAQGFPGRRVEAWRNVKLNALAQEHFRPASTLGAIPMALAPTAALIPEAHRMVFVDGHLSESHESMNALPAGVAVRRLPEAVASEPDALQADLAARAELDHHPFAALNTAFWSDGVVVDVAADTAVDQPIVLVFMASEAAAGVAVYPRVLVRTAAGAEVELAIVHAGPDGLSYMSCPVVEVSVGDNSRVTLHHLQEEGDGAYHFGLVHADLGRDARFHAHSFSTGAKIGRTDFYVNLNGEGAHAELGGLSLVNDGQYTDYHTWVRHQVGHCTSEQLFKGILDGKAESVFDGLIRVAKDAQKTDSQQQNRNLLLSPRALAHSNPRLEIYADDVKCAHGSTVGQLDKDALFYLRSRGIGEKDARGLLTFAFANDMLEAVGIESLKQYQRERLFGILPGDEAAKELS